MDYRETPLAEEKNIALCIVFSLITFGIYYIVWIYNICKKIKLMAREEPSAGGEVALIIFIPFYSLYWMYTRSQKLSVSATGRGIPLDDKCGLNLILTILGLSIVAMALIQSDLNLAAKYFQA